MMIKPVSIVCIAVMFFLASSICQAQTEKLKRNEIVSLSNEYGEYHLFVPRAQPKRILVIAHGTPGKDETAAALSKKFIKRWTDFAKKKKLLLLSVAFDRKNFGSEGKYGYGGYRGLFGRRIGADEHVIRLVEEYQELCSIQDGRCLIYGHSAGGQFLIRFCVRHPDRVAAAVASSPGRYSFPVATARWPYGAGHFDRKVAWSETEKPVVVVKPELEDYRKAARLPITVVFGADDLEKQPKRDAHPGTTRIDYGRGWVEAMNSLVELEDPAIRVQLENGIGHSSSRLTVPCQKALMKLQWIQPEKTQIFRQWRSKNKKFRVKARLVTFNGKVAKLQTVDGKELSVDLNKLSDADREFLQD